MSTRTCPATALALIALAVLSCRVQAPAATPTCVPATATAFSTQPSTPTPLPAAPTPVLTVTSTATTSPTPLPVASPTEQPRIVLTEVSTQGDAPGTLHVAGQAQVFEATVSLRVRSLDGRIIAQGVTMASQGAPEWGEFNVDVLYPPPAEEQLATLEVYEESPRDGSAQSLVRVPVTLNSFPELSLWNTFVSPEYHLQMRFPSTWHLNQGTFFPPPPATTKFSTYDAEDVHTLGMRDAEVWVRVSDTASIAEMEDLERKGYRKRKLILNGRSAVRYTDLAPHHGIYDVVYTLTGSGEYRIHLSAATHDFDAVFSLMLSTFAG